jgi:hypothetical protein
MASAVTFRRGPMSIPAAFREILTLMNARQPASKVRFLHLIPSPATVSCGHFFDQSRILPGALMISILSIFVQRLPVFGICRVMVA